MGWERGYYYRVRKINGRVVREYVGAGLAGELAANEQAERDRRRAAARTERADLDRLAVELDELSALADLLARAALLAAGYHQHERGQWRKRRAKAT
jgi:hypothetical protein